MATRVIAGLAGAPLYIGLILWPGTEWPFFGWPCAMMVGLMIALGLHEFYAGCRKAGYVVRDWLGYAAGTLFLVPVVVPNFDTPHGPFTLCLTLWLMAAVSSEALRTDRSPFRSLAPTMLGAIYVGWLFPFVLRLRLTGPAGVQHLQWLPPAEWMATAGVGGILLLYTVLVTAAVDSFAYFVGKAMGRRKLAPVLSPGKTVEGSLGGTLGGLILGGLLSIWFQLPLVFCLTAAGLIAVLAQLGDLAKSAMKRELGLKDFGSLIPGHGGVLDRFDSLMFAAPAVYWLMLLWQQ